MKKKFLKIGAVVLGAALVLGLVLPGVVAAKAQPQSQQTPQPNTVNGEVLSIAQDGKSFVVETGDEQQVTVNVDANTKYYKVPPALQRALSPGAKPCVPDKLREQVREHMGKGKSGDVERGLGQKKGQIETPVAEEEELDVDLEEIDEMPCDEPGLLRWMGGLKWLRNAAQASFADIQVGDTVAVRLMPNEDLAKVVFIIEALEIGRVEGQITALTTSSLTITRADSTTVDLTWDANTRFVLKGVTSVAVGQNATAFYNTGTKLAKLVCVCCPPAATITTTSTSVST